MRRGSIYVIIEIAPYLQHVVNFERNKNNSPIFGKTNPIFEVDFIENGRGRSASLEDLIWRRVHAARDIGDRRSSAPRKSPPP